MASPTFCDCGKSFLVLLVLEQGVPLDKARVSVEVESQILHLPKLEEEVFEVIIACLPGVRVNGVSVGQ